MALLEDDTKTRVKDSLKKGVGGAVEGGATMFAQAPPQAQLIIVVIALIIGAVLLYFVGTAIMGIIGFFGTAYGIAVLVLLMMAVGLYLFLKMSGVIGDQQWYVSAMMILVFMFLIIIFVGVLPAMQEMFITMFPFLIIGAVLYGAYLFIKHLPDRETKMIATIIIATIVILIPVSQIFIVPAVYGHPMRYDAYIVRGEDGKIDTKISSGEWGVFMSATTTLNTFGATVYETSREMWYLGDYEKYYYTITITDYYGKVLFKKEMAQAVLTKGDYVHDVGLYYLPNARYYDILIQITVYDSNLAPIAHNSAEISNIYGR